MLDVFDIPELRPLVLEFLTVKHSTLKNKRDDDFSDVARYNVCKFSWVFSDIVDDKIIKPEPGSREEGRLALKSGKTTVNSIDINNPTFSNELLLDLIKGIINHNPNIQLSAFDKQGAKVYGQLSEIINNQLGMSGANSQFAKISKALVSASRTSGEMANLPTYVQGAKLTINAN
jgi:hypothetical protein